MITLKINTVDQTENILDGSIQVSQKLTAEVDTATFQIRKTASRNLVPEYGDDVEIFDGDSKIFGGFILTVTQSPIAGPDGILFDVNCIDYTGELDRRLASITYENQTIADIILDLVALYAPGFTTENVSSSFVIEKIVFNQVPISTCLKRMADMLQYDWYIDENKDIHFFSKETFFAPFNLTDTNGNYIYSTLKRESDGSQVANRVKVRGGTYVGNIFTDILKVGGDDSKSFKLPFKFTNLTIARKMTGVTISIASPGIITRTAHGLGSGDKVYFETTGALPTGIVAGTTYYVLASGITSSTFKIATTPGGTAINTSGTQSGTHTLFQKYDVGDDFIDDFVEHDVLYNKDTQSIRFESNMIDGDLLLYSGNRDTRVFSVSEDTISIEQYGVFEKLIRDDSISSNEVARRRANAELYAYADVVVDASFITRTPGLRTGQLINIQSDIHGFDEDLIIKGVTFKQNGPENFIYKVELISTKRHNFVTFLQKLIEPEPRPGDETEVAEQIFTDTQNIFVVEEYEVVTPYANDASHTIEIDEEYTINALGANTDAIYTLAHVVPTSPTNPKRNGRLNVSFVVY